MIEIDFFGSSSPRSISARKQKLDNFKIEKSNNKNFLDYGFDYFDNPDYGVGYGGYHYDGRYKECVEKMISYYDLKPNDLVFEMGCAKGFILTEFHKQNMQVAGIDISAYAVENAYPEVKPFIKQGSCEEMDFASNSMDLVFSKEMLPHLNRDQLTLMVSEAQRVCKANNIFFEIQVVNDEEGQRLMKNWDETHTTIESADWWRRTLSELNFEGQVNFKLLF